MTEAAIADHGLVGDLHTAALISTDGSVDWFCCPRFDSPSVFGALLDDARGGHFRVRPAGGAYESKQMYFPDSAVLITRFFTADGVGEVVDFMPVLGREVTANHRLVRMVRCVRGCDAVRGRHRAAVRLRPSGASDRRDRERGGLQHRHADPDPARGARAGRRAARPGRGRRGRRAGNDRSGGGSGPRGDAGERRGRATAGGAARRGVAAVRRHGGVLAVLARPVDLSWALARGGEPLGDHPQADDVRPDRGAGRGADRGAARAGRRRAQLGLPLHLGPRRVVLGGRAAGHRVRRGGRAVRGVVGRSDPRAGRRRGRPAQHHVPGRRVERSQGGGARALVGLPRLAPGADRQRRRRPAPARHLRRGDGQHLRRPPGRASGAGPGLDGDQHRAGLGRGELGPARGGHLGDPRRAPGVHLRAADELGCA